MGINMKIKNRLQKGFTLIDKIPTMVLVSSAFGSGFLIAWFFELFAQFKLKAQLREKQKNIEKLEKELSRLNESFDASGQLDDSTSLPNTSLF